MRERFFLKPLFAYIVVLSALAMALSPFSIYCQDLLSLDEPSWVYKARGDRFSRNGETGEAVAEYRKALIKRKQEVVLPNLEGIEIEDGLSRLPENIKGEERSDAFGRLLYLFLNNHEDTLSDIRSALEKDRYREARGILVSLEKEAHIIGAEQVEAHAAALEQAIFKRDGELWDSLLKELSDSLESVLDVLASLDLLLDDGTSSIRGDRLEFRIERHTPYPEVNLALARIYMEEGLYELAYKQLSLFDRGRDYLQIPELTIEALYLRAEVLLRQEKRDDHERILEEIIAMDDNWDRDAKGLRGYVSRPFSQIPESRIEALHRDEVSRGKFGKAYFEVGQQKYSNGSEPGAEPYLIMALLYGYEGEKSYALLERYYSLTDQPRNLKKLADIESLLQYH